MNYEQKYKELAGKIKKADLYAQTDSTKAVLEDILPELTESEDERIREALIELVKFSKTSCFELLKDKPFNVVSMDAMLAWLEKQGNSNLHEFAMPIGEVNNDYSMKHAEMLKDLMSQMDVRGQDDHRAKIAEREYWRKLRGDILLALINKSTPIDLSPALPDKASDLTERLYRQDKDFFSNLDES